MLNAELMLEDKNGLTYKVSDLSDGFNWTPVWFYAAPQKWSCEACITNNCPHIKAAQKITAPGAERLKQELLTEDDDTISNSKFSTAI